MVNTLFNLREEHLLVVLQYGQKFTNGAVGFNPWLPESLMVYLTTWSVVVLHGIRVLKLNFLFSDQMNTFGNIIS